MTAQEDEKKVPAHAGGVDLSIQKRAADTGPLVPAHAGGVDLSHCGLALVHLRTVPAHAGGVDLSNQFVEKLNAQTLSPPMRAGWI